MVTYENYEITGKALLEQIFSEYVPYVRHYCVCKEISGGERKIDRVLALLEPTFNRREKVGKVISGT